MALLVHGLPGYGFFDEQSQVKRMDCQPVISYVRFFIDASTSKSLNHPYSKAGAMTGKKNDAKELDPLKELTRLHTECLKAEKEYRKFLNKHVAEILRRLKAERNDNNIDGFSLVGKKTGLFKADRHARRLLFALDAVDQKYMNEKKLQTLLKEGISISAIGQILEGRTPPTPAEFQKRLDTLKKPGGVTSLGEELGKRTSLAGKRRKKLA